MLSTAQHGPHLPLGVDTYIATGVAQRVAQARYCDAHLLLSLSPPDSVPACTFSPFQEVGAVVAPTLAYGYKSVPCMGGGPYNGTTGLDGATLTSSLRDIVRELVRHGVRRILVLDGHFENQMFSIEAVNLAQRDAIAAGVNNLQIMRLEYWDHVQPETTAKVFPNGYPGAQLEHAAVQETSLMLVLQPQLVDMDAIPGAGRWPADRGAAFPAYTMEPDSLHPEWAPFSGVLSPANAASLQKGEWLMADHVAGIAAAMRAEWGSDPLAGLK